MPKTWLILLSKILAIAASSLYSSSQVLAQNITLDGSLGVSGNLTGPNYTIPQNVGQTVGNNLFHSFGRFNLNSNEAAIFQSNPNIQNILSRVTGNNLSLIDGLIRTNSGVNLFLINPSGIVFGENARLDVGGSFVASTANALRFGDLGYFSATEKNFPSSLLTINPSALWFNQINQNVGIKNNSIAPAGKESAGFDVFGLRVPDGKSLLLVGGNVSMDGGELNAYGGRVELGGLAEPGNVNILFDGNNPRLEFTENVARADISLNQAFVFVEEAGAGNITFNARNIEILGGSELSAGIGSGLGKPDTIAGDIILNATGAIDVAKSFILNNVRLGAKGNGGNITITSGKFLLRDSAGLDTSTSGQGNAGNVTVRAKDFVSLAGAGIFSTVEAGGVGKGGNIDINAATLSLKDNAQLQTITRAASATQPAGQGNAGNVNITVASAVDIFGEKNGFGSGIISSLGRGSVGNGGNITIDSGSLSLRDGAQLVTSTAGQGNAGNVTVRAKDFVSLAGAGIFSTVEAGGVGKGGNIDINAATLSLKDNAQLQTITRAASVTQTAGQGDAGNVNLKVAGSVDIFGERTRIGSLLNTGSVGNGGNITIDSGSFSLRDGSQLVTSTLGQGDAGNVTVRAKDGVSITGNAVIFSTVEAGGVGKGGNIDINAATLSIKDGTQLQTITRAASATQPAGRGKAGNVNIKVAGAVDISGRKNGFGSGIFSNLGIASVGNGGNITIDSGSFLLRDGAQLVTSTAGQGNAGNVMVRVKDFVYITDATIFSTIEAGGVGKGGNIDINAASLSLADGAQLLTFIRRASDTQPAGMGNAGNVSIKVTGAVDIFGEKDEVSSILSRLEAGTKGDGGNITIDSDSLSLRNGAQLDAASFGQGNAGSIYINTKDTVNISGTSKKSGLSSALFSSTVENSTGKGGDISVITKIFRISNGALLDARTVNDKKSGDIRVSADIVEALNGGQLTTTSSSSGNAGKITVNATDKVIISGSDPNFSNRITKFLDNVLNVGANSGFFVSSTSSGTTGDIEINSPKITLDNQGQLNANSTSGNGGNININSDLLLLRRGSKISTDAGTDQKGGDGGNININSIFTVAVPNEDSDITANAFDGKGGNVTITARNQGIFGIEARFKESPTTNDITASSENGAQGEVFINQPDTDPSRGLIELPTNLVDASQQIAQGCTPRMGETTSRFISTGRGGIPENPYEPLRKRAVINNWVALPNNENQQTRKINEEITTKPTSKTIVEAQGWVINPRGEVELVAQVSAGNSHSPSIQSNFSCNSFPVLSQ
ncbi:filamentous hemagglutinin outer membrane protein [Calothrix sp. NIES-4101]|nr:filamentous hemagglutinin outer membrane protein [Calothrix sp. NIES-4101]